jgi:hypothetical protein
MEEEARYSCQTTCLECGAVGEGPSSSPGIVHKMILCDECKAKLRAGRTRIVLKLARDGTDDVATFEVSGSELWVNGLIPSISQFVMSAASAFEFDSENWMAVGRELSQALEAVMASKGYEGEFVTVTRQGS